MEAFHSIWTKPSLQKKYKMENSEILTMMLSALNWRKYNGQIKLVADKTAIDYLDSLNLLHLWNGGVEELFVDEDINPQCFWAAGKIFALSQQKSPMVMIDTDVIVWKSIDEYKKDNSILVMHREELSFAYPEKSFFKCKEGYCLDDNFDWTVLPCNTALLYIDDMDFLGKYVNKAIEFMKNCTEEINDICSMVFAEQRILAMCAKMYKKEITTILDYKKLNEQDNFTHIWGYKQVLKRDYKANAEFCNRCINRIKKDFPEELHTLEKIL